MRRAKRRKRTLGKNGAQLIERSGGKGGKRPARCVPDEGHHGCSERAAEKGFTLRYALGNEVVERFVAQIPGRAVSVDHTGVQRLEPTNGPRVRPPRPADVKKLLHRDP